MVLGGEDFEDFTTPSADDRIKLYVPSEAGDLAARDFTPRHFDAEAKTLTIDIALHSAGPAIRWAEQAQAGDVVELLVAPGSRSRQTITKLWMPYIKNRVHRFDADRKTGREELPGHDEALDPGSRRQVAEHHSGRRRFLHCHSDGCRSLLPRKLLLEARQELAREYLNRPDIDVAEVAYLLGYEDSNSFYRAFRTWEGTTPSQLRAELKRPVN
jgi:AraC-like DNA-binding protein